MLAQRSFPLKRFVRRILEGRSISFVSEIQNRVFAIVGGIIPIAVGLALLEAERRENARVHCFMGEMTSETGLYMKRLNIVLISRYLSDSSWRITPSPSALTHEKPGTSKRDLPRN
jgi:hypothetical protein